MMRPSRPALALPLLLAATACITAYNDARITRKEGAPEVERRPDGCHVDVLQDGERLERPHAEIGSVVLDWPRKKIEEQGPEGAINTLKAFACEKGAFVVKDLRALPMGVGEGMIYEGTLATFLGDDGKPLNAKGAPAAADAGPAPVEPAAAPSPSAPSG